MMPEETNQRYVSATPLRMVFTAGVVALLAACSFSCGVSETTTSETTTSEEQEGSNLLKLDLGNGIRLELVRIPAGQFIRGSPPDELGREADETPHEVTLTRPFYLGRFEVTQAQYEQVTGENPSRFKGPDLPVETVSWEDAQNFCRLLSEKSGQAVRLPTEAEWEYAARAGTTSVYHMGPKLSFEQANYDQTKTPVDPNQPITPTIRTVRVPRQPAGSAAATPGTKPELTESVAPASPAPAVEPAVASPNVARGTTTPVGAFPPNAWGLYDIHGNVWEWCLDWYAKYPEEAVTDPRGPETGTRRASRGGAWGTDYRTCRVANRRHRPPDERLPVNGFRVAVEIEPASR